MGFRAIFPENAGFVKTHWPARSLVHHGPLSRLRRLARAPELASPIALVDAAKQSGIELWAERENEPFHRATSWPTAATLETDPVAYTCFGVERFVPAVRELLDAIQGELDVPWLTPTCHGYVSGRGSRIPAHFDRQENLALQIVGTKRWQLAENETVAFPHENHRLGSPPVRPLQRLARAWPSVMPERAQRVVMRPGSALFFPRGMWHATETLTPSLLLTILFPAPSWAQLLSARLLERLLLDESFREPASTSPQALRSRTDAFVAAARAVCDDGEGHYVVTPDATRRLRRGRLEAKALSIDLDPRFVPLVRWVLARRGPFALALAARHHGSMVEAKGVVAFLEEHGVLRRASRSEP